MNTTFLSNTGGETRWNGNKNESSTECVSIPSFVNIITREKTAMVWPRQSNSRFHNLVLIHCNIILPSISISISQVLSIIQGLMLKFGNSLFYHVC
jgi:hypothetical protein